MPSIAPHVVEPALQASADPLAADLLARLRHEAPEPIRARATHPFSRREALRIYRDKAGKGDRPSVRTDGYPALLAALAEALDGEVVVHGVTFSDAVYLVFTDPHRIHCLAVVRKQLLLDCIEPFRSEHAQAFDALNRAWLLEHGLLEPPDERQLADPWGEIIGPGGQIFVAVRQHEVVGTCAVIPHGLGVLELAKLAVAPAAQGQGLGRRLVEACLAYANRRHMRRIVLVSNSRLGTALHLYETVGFQHRPLPADVQYATADVYMELDLAGSVA